VISVDTLRLDHLGVAGHRGARTPRIDALIRSGTWFAEAITPLPRTSPAIASLLTGLDPAGHGCRAVGEAIHGGTTLAELLARRGYVTVGVSSSAVAGPGQGLDRGFRDFADWDEIKRRYPEIVEPPEPAAVIASGKAPVRVGWAEATTRTALTLVEGEGRDAPVHLWVHYWDPHMLYSPPTPWLQQVDAPACWALYEEYAERAPGLMWRVRGGFDEQVREAVSDCRKLYDAEIAYTDHEIGRLVDEIAALRDRPSLLVFTADHGENFGEEGSFFEHGDNAHDSALRVPLAVAGPGVAAGRVDRGSASLADVVPTLLALLGVPPGERPPADGRELTGRLTPSGEPLGPDDGYAVFSESGVVPRNQFFRTLLTGRAAYRACINGERYTLCDRHDGEESEPRLYDHDADPALTRDVADQHPAVVARLREARKLWPVESARIRVARTPRFKLVQRPLLEGGYSDELYDLRADPEESRDVADRHPEIVTRLRSALAAWDRPHGSAGPIDPETLESLRSLGYLPRP